MERWRRSLFVMLVTVALSAISCGGSPTSSDQEDPGLDFPALPANP